VKCESCGFENLDHATTCMGCGTVLFDGPKLPPPKPLTDEDIEELGLYQPNVFDQIESGEVISNSFGIYFRNFFSFFAVTLIAYSPVIALTIFTSMGGFEELDSSVVTWVVLLVTIGAALLAFPFATAALTYGVLQNLRDKKPEITDLISVGLRMMITVVLVAILQFLATMGGFLLLIIPGIIISIALTVAVPVAVEERPGALKALQRSFELTKGYRGRIFLVFFGLGLINIIASLVTTGITYVSPGVGGILDTFRQILHTGVSSTAAALLYYQLRSIKESLDLNELASVFD